MKNEKKKQPQPQPQTPGKQQHKVTELSDEQLEQVQGGLNPQPLPPHGPEEKF